MDDKRLINIRSNAVDSNNIPREPEINYLNYGELAINYKDGVETVFIKNDNDEIVSFSSDDYYTEKKLGSGFTGNNITVTEALTSTTISKYFRVTLNQDGSVNTKPTDLLYQTIKSNLSASNRQDSLDVFWEYASGSVKRIIVPVVGISTINNVDGDITFSTTFSVGLLNIYISFTLNSNDVLATSSLFQIENIDNKVNNFVNPNTTTYPTTLAVFNEFMRKPVTVWEAEAGSGILASNSNIVENPNWHLTNLDFTPYKRLKFYIAPGGTSNTQFTPSVVLEMSLENRAGTTTYGYYTASIICQNPNDANRLYALNMCVSNTKDKVFFGRQNSLYGTAATSINEAPRYLYKIEGYFD